MAEQEYVDVRIHIVFNGEKIVSETSKVVAKSSKMSSKFKKILSDDFAIEV